MALLGWVPFRWWRPGWSSRLPSRNKEAPKSPHPVSCSGMPTHLGRGTGRAVFLTNIVN
jgi:hypothetical protein